MANQFDEAVVKFRPDFTGFAAEYKTKLNAITRSGALKVKVGVDFDRATLQRNFKQAAGTLNAKVNLDFNRTTLQRNFRAAVAGLSANANVNINLNVNQTAIRTQVTTAVRNVPITFNVNTTALRAQIQAALAGININPGVRGGGGSGGGGAGKNSWQQNIGSIINVNAAIINTLTRVVALAGGAITNFAASIPAQLGPAAVVISTAALAVNGLGDAFKAFKDGDPEKIAEAMAKLSVSARAFVNETRAVGSAWGRLQNTVQQNFFESINGSLSSLTSRMLPTLNTELGATATSLGIVASRMLRWVSSANSLDRIREIIRDTRSSLDPLTKAAENFGSAFLNLGARGNPVFTALVNTVERVSAAFLRFSQRNDLDDMMQQTGQTVRVLSSLLGNLAGALNNLLVNSGNIAALNTLLQVFNGVAIVVRAITSVFAALPAGLQQFIIVAGLTVAIVRSLTFQFVALTAAVKGAAIVSAASAAWYRLTVIMNSIPGIMARAQAAVISFRGALISTGIGAALVGIGLAIAYISNQSNKNSASLQQLNSDIDTSSQSMISFNQAAKTTEGSFNGLVAKTLEQDEAFRRLARSANEAGFSTSQFARASAGNLGEANKILKGTAKDAETYKNYLEYSKNHFFTGPDLTDAQIKALRKLSPEQIKQLKKQYELHQSTQILVDDINAASTATKQWEKETAAWLRTAEGMAASKNYADDYLKRVTTSATAQIKTLNRANDDAYISQRAAAESLADAYYTASQNRIKNARAVRDAEASVADAVDSVKEAENGVRDARKKAYEELAALKQKSIDLGKQEIQNVLDLERARLQEQWTGQAGSGATVLERAQAILDRQKAQGDLTKTRSERATTNTELATRQRQGIEGSPEVVAAKKQLEDSTSSLVRAKEQLADTREQVRRDSIMDARAIRDAQYNASTSMEDWKTTVSKNGPAIAHQYDLITLAAINATRAALGLPLFKTIEEAKAWDGKTSGGGYGRMTDPTSANPYGAGYTTGSSVPKPGDKNFVGPVGPRQNPLLKLLEKDAQDAKEAIKNEFQIKSPSKFMESIGKSLSDGLFNGFKGVVDTIRPVNESLNKDVFSVLAQRVKRDLPAAIAAGVAAMGREFAKLQGLFATPVNWILENVYNKGLAHMWNEVSNNTGGGLPKLRAASAVQSPTLAGAGTALPYGSGYSAIRRATGGRVDGPGGPTDDRVPAWLSNGEYVVRAKAVDKIGVHNLDKLNKLQGFAEGGLVTGWRWPLPGGYRNITAPFGENRGSYSHGGTDIAAPTGTPAYAALRGRVVQAGWYGGGGNTISLQHQGNILSRYMHLSRIIAQIGQEITTGGLLGLVGSTGQSTGPHLHFQVEQGRNKINPMGLFGPGGGAAPGGAGAIPAEGSGIDTTALIASLSKMPGGASNWGKLVKGATAKLLGAAGTSGPGTPGQVDLSASASQNAQAIVSAAREAGASLRDQTIAVATAYVESSLRNDPRMLDHDSVGLFQQRAAWGSHAARMDPRTATRMFLFGGASGQNGLFDYPERVKWSMGRAAQRVQVSAFPDRYDQRGVPVARRYTGYTEYDSGGIIKPGTTIVQNNTGKPEAVFTAEETAMFKSMLHGAKVENNFYGDIVEPVQPAMIAQRIDMQIRGF